MTAVIQLGLVSFGDVGIGVNESSLPHAQVIRNVIAEGAFADKVGVDFFGLGEHHRADFAISAPDVVLSVIAGQTKNIRLGSATTVLSTDDPIRVFQRFSTLNAATNGRAEIILGRGWFPESFYLFGYDRDEYDNLFQEKLDLFSAIVRNHKVTRKGDKRSPLTNQNIFPPVEVPPLRTWVAVGSTPETALRAARYDLPLMIAVIGGDADRFKPLVDIYRLAFERYGRPSQSVGVHSAGHVAETDTQAREAFWRFYKPVRDRLGAERGWPPLERARFEVEVDRGSLYVGSPETVAKKIAHTVRTLGASRFDMKYSVGDMGHDTLLRCIELFGTKVIPLVKERVA